MEKQQQRRQPQQHNRQPQQCRNQQQPQTINIAVNIGTIVMPVTVNVVKGGKRGCEQQPSQIDQLVKEVIAAVGKKLQQ